MKEKVGTLTQSNKIFNCRIDYMFLIFAVLAIFYILAPYWMFGSYSFAGWYDERFLQLPAAFMQQIAGYHQGYISSYAGGLPIETVASSPFVSLYHLALKSMPFWFASFFFRFLAYLFMYLAGYTFLRLKFLLNPFLAFSLALFACTGWKLEGWIIGLGCLFPGLFLMSIGFFCEFKTEKKRLLYVTIVSCILSATTAPTYFLPALGFLFIFIALFIKNCQIKTIKKLLLHVYSWAIFTLLMLTNWSIVLYNIFIKYSAHSARQAQNVHSITVWEIPRNIWQSLQSLWIGMRRGTDDSILYLVVAILILTLLTNKLEIAKRVFLQLIFLIFFPIIIAILLSVVHIPLLSTYKWDSLSEIYPVAAIIILASVLKENNLLLVLEKQAHLGYKKIAGFLCCTILPAFILCLSVWNVQYTLFVWNFSDLKNYSGIAATSIYSNLKELSFEKDNARFLTIGHLFSMLPVYYNLDNFAGLSDNFSIRRYYYTQHMCKVGYACELNDGHQVFLCAHNSCPKFPLGFDLALLRMVNIKYILNNEEIANTNLRLVSKHPGVMANDINYFGKTILKSKFENQPLVNPLYVYKFKKDVWPRVFSAVGVKNSNFSYKNDKFYSELGKLKFKTLLIASEDVTDTSKLAPNKAMKVLKYSFSKKGAEININGKSGVLVFNQGYTPHWHASCSGNVLRIVPVNGLFMAVQVPRGCSNIQFSLGRLANNSIEGNNK